MERRGFVDDLQGALDAFAAVQHARRGELESLVRAARARLGVGAVRVSRRGIWGFGRLESARFLVGDHSYEVALLGGRIVTSVATAVGGVGLAPQPVARDEWVRLLTAEIDRVIRPES